eukprot:5143460-Alexandrium_andersonii.AAC.1
MAPHVSVRVQSHLTLLARPPVCSAIRPHARPRQLVYLSLLGNVLGRRPGVLWAGASVHHPERAE